MEMKIYLKAFIGIALFLGFIATTFLWFEAEKEVRILCSMITPGQPIDRVTETLNTGTFLEYRQAKLSGKEAIIVDSPYTLGNSRCLVDFSTGNLVLSSQYRQSFELNKLAAWLGVAGLSALAVFQLLLATGLPLGKFAWGGRHKKLPAKLRIASAISIPVLVFGGIILLERAGIIQILEAPKVSGYGVWILVLLFALSTLGNLASGSESERKVGTPIALLLCCLCIIVGMAG